MTERKTRGSVFFVSLGCDKNLTDTEKMLGALHEEGWTVAASEEEADAIVINTCCFIGDAKEESINTILEMSELRREGRCRALVVTGCLAQRYQQEILDEIPEVDAVIGTTAFDRIARVLNGLMDEEPSCAHTVTLEDLGRLAKPAGHRMLTTGGHYAYLKIAEGCGKHCTYCVIPKVRGAYRSVPMDELLEEASRLAADGVRELILVAQETTLWGTDLYGEKRLHVLLEKLCRIEGIRWIRLLYCYPEEIYDELVEVMAREPKICHYLDLPIQHANDDILRRMGRRTDRESLERIIEGLREKIPDIVLRTTLISGFPGETLEQHEELMDFIDRMEFDRLGVFAYSREEDTPAASMPDQVPEEEKERRRDELMALQQEISRDLNEQRVGSVLTVMIEGKVTGEEDVWAARSRGDAPDVDGYVFIHTGAQLMSGDLARVKITGAGDYDLTGVLEDEDESAE